MGSEFEKNVCLFVGRVGASLILKLLVQIVLFQSRDGFIKKMKTIMA